MFPVLFRGVWSMVLSWGCKLGRVGRWCDVLQTVVAGSNPIWGWA